MATAIDTADPRVRRRWPWLVALAIVAAGLAWYWTPLNGYAQAGAAYSARVVCSCRYVGGRDMDSCKGDLEPGMELVMLSQYAAEKSVTARFPLLRSETATYREGWGCVLEPWH